jgi:AcrR family transcriptional regulator
MPVAKSSKQGRTYTRRPRGKDAVMSAVLDAATALFAKYGPGSVSVRDIARAARINHALLHRHFGSKRAVLDAVLERSVQQLSTIASEIVDARSGARQLFLSTTTPSFYRRILARSMLDGVDIEKILPGFPIMERLTRVVESTQREAPANEIRVRVACVTALVTAWSLFEPLFLRGTGLEQENKDEIHEKVRKILQTFLETPCRQPASGGDSPPAESTSELLAPPDSFPNRKTDYAWGVRARNTGEKLGRRRSALQTRITT